jgi:hypothetical protein
MGPLAPEQSNGRGARGISQQALRAAIRNGENC